MLTEKTVEKFLEEFPDTKESFALYGDTDIASPVGTSSNNNWKLLLSLGFKF